MFSSRSLCKYLGIAVVLNCSLASAATVHVTASAQNSEFLDGVNLSDDTPIVAINADWTFEQGGFAGADCYVSTVDSSRGINRGCDFYAGYFTPLTEKSAISLQLTHHEYARALNTRWDFTELSASWHLTKKTSLTATYSEDWLGRPFDSYSVRADTQIALSESLGLNLSANFMDFESGTAVDNLVSAKASMTYTLNRWSAELGLIYTDSEQQRMLPFDVDEPEVLLSVSYRLY